MNEASSLPNPIQDGCRHIFVDEFRRSREGRFEAVLERAVLDGHRQMRLPSASLAVKD
jgi:hypothetical protein